MIQYNESESVAVIYTVAEDLFARHGYHGTSIRQITQKAGVNLAAINYHFGNKESLYRQVIIRRLNPINEMRSDRLKKASGEAGGGSIPLGLIIDILARPLFELCGNRDNKGMPILSLIARSMAEPLPFEDDRLTAELSPITTRFSQAIRRHIPAISPEEFMWRLNFVVGAMHHTLATIHRMKELTHGLCANNDSEGAMNQFIRFAITTLTAPPNPQFQ